MAAWSPRLRILLIVLRGLIGPWPQFGVLAGLRVQLINGLKGTMGLCDLFAVIAPATLPGTALGFIPRGRAKPDGQLIRHCERAAVDSRYVPLAGKRGAALCSGARVSNGFGPIEFLRERH
jgi:hypothetical protein